MKQSKKPNYAKDCLTKLETTYRTNSSLMWKTIIKGCPDQQNNIPSGTKFFEYFKSKSISKPNPYFEYGLERTAVEYLTYKNLHPKYNSPDYDWQ